MGMSACLGMYVCMCVCAYVKRMCSDHNYYGVATTDSMYFQLDSLRIK